MMCPRCGKAVPVRKGHFRSHGNGRGFCSMSTEPTPEYAEVLARRNRCKARRERDYSLLKGRPRVPRDWQGRRVL